MKQQLIFKCKITNYYIEFIVDEEKKEAIVNTIICDYKQIKAWMSLLRTSIEKLKSMKIQTIIQSVSYFDWNNYLKNKTSWKISNDDKINQVYEISCEINKFLENYGIGIGII